ncbi:hypothetical protein D3C72_2035920 [compost metagenome]
MPADVFAAEQQFTLAVHEQCCMHGTAMLAQWLEGVDALAQADQPLGRGQGRTRQHGQIR